MLTFGDKMSIVLLLEGLMLTAIFGLIIIFGFLFKKRGDIMKLCKPVMRFLFSYAVLSFLSMPILAIDYDDFPPELQQILDERIDELNTKGGICIAGRVTTSNRTYISGGRDVLVNLYHGWDEPLWVYEHGWFIMGRTGSSRYAGPGIGFVLRAFGYDPIDAFVTVLDGEMTYLEFRMLKTPADNLATVVGTVFDENNKPFNQAHVSISFPFANHGISNKPYMEVMTYRNGGFSFEGLSITKHKVAASASGYAYHSDTFTPPVGGVAVEDRTLFPNRRIVIDYVYQADGSRSFTEGDLRIGTIDWLNGAGGVDFSDGKVEGYEYPDSVRDIEMRQDQDVLKFRIFYAGKGNGFYDVGAVDFNSVTEATDTGYSRRKYPCLVGHVYVVRTYEEDHYAKFIVKSDESSFRTVVPSDPDPIDFAGYGLTIDFTSCSDYGKVYVRKYSGIPAGIQNSVLPYYWEITGMTDVTFSADLIITYDEADVTNSGLQEHDLILLQSTDSGQTWLPLETQTDTLNNTLYVEGIDSFSWFAIATEHSDAILLR